MTAALIGAGAWGKNIARNLHRLGVFHTLCDRHEATLDTMQALYPEIQVTTNVESVFENPAIDKVFVAAPPFQHHELAKRAMIAGKDVFVEKPLCMTIAEGEDLVQVAKETGRILMVGHLLHYHPYIMKLQELVREGALGHLRYISSHRLNLGPFRKEENALWNFAPHDFSVILSLSGDLLPEEVRCTGGAYLTEGVADTTMTTLRFEGNLRAHVYVSWLNPFKEQKLVVVGSSGMAVFDDTKPWEEKLQLFTPAVTPVIVPQKEPLYEELSHFITCCNERCTPRTDGEEGLRVLKVLQAAQESLTQEGELTSCSTL